MQCARENWRACQRRRVLWPARQWPAPAHEAQPCNAVHRLSSHRAAPAAGPAVPRETCRCCLRPPGPWQGLCSGVEKSPNPAIGLRRTGASDARSTPMASRSLKDSTKKYPTNMARAMPPISTSVAFLRPMYWAMIPSGKRMMAPAKMGTESMTPTCTGLAQRLPDKRRHGPVGDPDPATIGEVDERRQQRRAVTCLQKCAKSRHGLSLVAPAKGDAPI